MSRTGESIQRMWKTIASDARQGLVGFVVVLIGTAALGFLAGDIPAWSLGATLILFGAILLASLGAAGKREGKLEGAAEVQRGRVAELEAEIGELRGQLQSERQKGVGDQAFGAPGPAVRPFVSRAEALKEQAQEASNNHDPIRASQRDAIERLAADLLAEFGPTPTLESIKTSARNIDGQRDALTLLSELKGIALQYDHTG